LSYEFGPLFGRVPGLSQITWRIVLENYDKHTQQQLKVDHK